jgi:DNA-binding transcriptional LysR family regulator
MLYFAQKILRTKPGNWTFVIVTDRTELDDQIAKTFAAMRSTDQGARGGPGAKPGAFERVLPAWDLGTVEAYAVYANGNAIKPAARAFIDFLAHDFRDTPP